MVGKTASYSSISGNWLKCGYATILSAAVSYYIGKAGWTITSACTACTASKACAYVV
jgi:hypothetical protein